MRICAPAHALPIAPLTSQLIKAADQLKLSVEEIELRLREAAWVTPRNVDVAAFALPSTEQLLDGAWRVSCDGVVSQYIRAHPRAAAANSESPLQKLRYQGKQWPTTDKASGSTTYRGVNYMDGLGICRLCPEWSALYAGHNVYVCKRLAIQEA